jgi:predicted lactoylglutathione lyase
VSRMAFVNLPVQDLARTTDFFSQLGFDFSLQLANQDTTCMVVSDTTVVMLHRAPVFNAFTDQDSRDTSTSREVVLGLSADSREEVDSLIGTAVRAGGRALGETVEQGSMYMRAFRDLDGHQWSFIYLDLDAAR